MSPVDGTATDYESAFNDVSSAYVKTAESNAKANVVSNEGLLLQRKLKARYEESQ